MYRQAYLLNRLVQMCKELGFAEKVACKGTMVILKHTDIIVASCKLCACGHMECIGTTCFMPGSVTWQGIVNISRLES